MATLKALSDLDAFADAVRLLPWTPSIFLLRPCCRNCVVGFQRGCDAKRSAAKNLDRIPNQHGGRMPPLPEFPEPLECILWRSPGRLENIQDVLDTIETYMDDSHHMRRLVKCRECGQLYFYEFLEFVDYQDGEDPQYRTYIPVASGEDAALLSSRPQWD